MLIEVVNALLVAFVATEVLIRQDANDGDIIAAARATFAQPLTRRGAAATAAANVLDWLLHFSGVRSLLVALTAPLHAAAGWRASRALLEALLIAFAGASVGAAVTAAARRGYVPSRWADTVSKIYERSWKVAAGGFAALWLLVYAIIGPDGATGGLVLGASAVAHTPRIVFVLAGFTALCYWDCRRLRGGDKGLSLREFASALGRGLAYVLPVFPFLAVGISTVFFFLVSFLEAAGLPVHWLDWPVYYGTLYGPLTWVYASTKRNVARHGHHHARLPSASSRKKKRSIPGVGSMPVR